jgi:MFS family permease
MAMTGLRDHAGDGARPARGRGWLVVRRCRPPGCHGPIRLLLAAWAVCYAGDLAAFTAASVYAYHAGGAGLVGVLGLAKGVPAGLLVPLVTSWSDRVRRERLLIASVTGRALLLAAAAAAMTGGGHAVVVVVLVALQGGLASVYRQVQAALLPWLARTPDELTGANTTASVLQSAATVGGPALAAGLVAVGLPQAAMLAACGLTAAGAALLTGVRPRSSPDPARAAGRLRQLGADIAAGWQAGAWRPGARALFVPAAIQTFARGVLTVLTVVIAVDLFSLGPAGIGWLTAVLGAGGLLAGPLAATLVRGRKVARCFGAGVAGWGLPLILLALAYGRYWPYLMFAVIGVANVFDDAGVYSALQQLIPPRLTGRALGTRRGALLISMGLGSAAAPLLILACGARGTLIVTGALLITAAAWSLPRLTAIDRTISAPGPGYALLRQVPFFGPLPIAIAEHLATELKTATYQPGDVIIREGEPGDRFYLIESGQARATAGGRHLAELGPAGWFGEIALLRPVPRTATIIATTPLHAKVLAREEFLAAVTGNPDSAQHADELISARLRANGQADAQHAIAADPGGNHADLTSPASPSCQT